MSTIWHIGMAIPDLEAAKRQLGQLWGLRWRPTVERPLSLSGAGGERHDVDVHVTFSLGGPFAIELWESISGTPLQTPESAWLHHVGYWVDDFGAEAARLGQLGHPPVLTNGDDPLLNRGPGGLFVEPCDLHRDQPYLRDLYPLESPLHSEPLPIGDAINRRSAR